MRKLMLGGMLAALFAVMQGCVVTSVHPLYRSQDDIIFDEGLVGRWNTEDGEVWEFNRKEEQGQTVPNYLVIVTDNNEPLGILEGILVEINGRRFLDIAPYDFEADTFMSVFGSTGNFSVSHGEDSSVNIGEDTSDNNSQDLSEGLWFNNALLFPTHTVLQLRRSGDVLEAAFIDYEWISNQAEAGTLDLDHEIEDDLVLITASPEELRNFVSRYADDEKVFEFEEFTRE